MIVTLVTKEKLFSMSLPEKARGRYWLSDADGSGCARQAASVEGIQGKWLLRGSEYLVLNDAAGAAAAEVELYQTGIQVVPARYREDGSRVQILVEPATEDRKSFQKYFVSGECRLDIGRGPQNQIVFENKYVSTHHATLVWDGNQWSITDTQSSNGVFVNGRRVVTTPMLPGDSAYIMGMKLIVGSGFFALNNPDGCVRVSAPGVAPFQPQAAERAVELFQKESEAEMFCRSPRFYRSVVKGDVKIDPPPTPQRIEEVPLPLMLGPALTMGVTSIAMVAVAVINYLNGTANLLSTVPTVVMAASMLCGMILWPILTKRHEKKKRNRAELARRDKYREYLDNVRNQIYGLILEQKEILTERSPDLADCEKRILERRRDLWERSVSHDDFLNLRLGLGQLPLKAEIRHPDQRFAVDGDYLLNEAFRLADEPKVLNDVPVCCSLYDNVVTGVVGTRDAALRFVQGLMLQTAALHSYTEVKLVCLVDAERLDAWSFARWLPHVWSDDGAQRYFAAGDAEIKALSASLERVLAERLEQQGPNTGKKLPHYVLLIDGTDLAEKAEMFKKALSAPVGAGFSCVVAAARLQDLPPECSTVIELGEGESIIYDRNDTSGERQSFRCEDASGIRLEEAASVLANLRVDTQSEQYELPDMITFLDLFEVGKVEHLNALTRWRDNNPVNSLAAPVGTGNGGEPFYLDLHEKFQGPHGLVAGMTGSGKSEFIITFILSLAVNYHPNEVAFILIDYKGGGLAGAFEDPEKGIRLPHLAGTITNLDGTAIKRSLISIQSELRRRQALFNEARRVSGEGTIDIYKYQKMYRGGLVKEPVPHLFIISDEFAELKAQQPEFMEQLISAARIGRSLGVHLILATQKPAGVVDDQIWSNSRFRVCLKVQERADSMDMIKRPDAAELAETGRFYLQVGFNEFFAIGQSAWCGAPYLPAERMEQKQDESVTVIDHLGRVLAEAKPQKKKGGESRISQVVAIVRYLSDLAAEDQAAARELWLPPLPETICLNDLREKYGWTADVLNLEPVVGEYDDPFNQTQGLLTLPFTREGNVLVYSAAGGGKTTMLNTVLCGLMADYDAAHLNVYAVDLGEETLRAFEKAPQVGGVLFSNDGEKIGNLFKMLREEVAYRKKLFAADDGDYRTYCRRTGQAVPHILVIIRNYVAFAEQFELLEEQLLQLTREGNKYGIYFLVTANAANAVRYRVSQNFATVLALQLNDRSDYVGLFGGTDGVFPSKAKGRGIYKTNQTYEFQVAQFAPDASQNAIRALAKELADHAGAFARPVPVLPEWVTPKLFTGPIEPSEFPVGIEKKSLKTSCLDLKRTVISLVLTTDIYEMGPTVQGVAELMTRIKDAKVTVLDGANLFSDTGGEAYSYLNKNFAPRVEALFNEMVRRNNTYKTAVNNGQPAPVFGTEYYVITGYQAILDGLADDGKDKLQTLLEKAEPEYRMRFILCDGTAALKAHTTDPWYKRHIPGTDGVWAGDGISDQYMLRLGKVTNDLYADVPPHFGYMVQRGKPTLIKLLVSDLAKGADEG